MSKKQITRRAQDFRRPCSPLQTPTSPDVSARCERRKLVSRNNVDQRPSPDIVDTRAARLRPGSTVEQNPDAQHDALVRAGVHPDQIYVDRTSGAKFSRPAWDAVVKALRAGDVLVATRLDRVGRSTSHLVILLDHLARRGVAFRFLEQGIDTTPSEGRLMYRMLAAIASSSET